MKEFKRRFYFDQQGVFDLQIRHHPYPALLSQHGNVVDIHG